MVVKIQGTQQKTARKKPIVTRFKTVDFGDLGLHPIASLRLIASRLAVFRCR